MNQQFLKHLIRFAMVNFLLILVFVLSSQKTRVPFPSADNADVITPQTGENSPATAPSTSLSLSPANPSISPNSTLPQQTTESPSPTETPQPAINLADEASGHNTKSDCYVIYGGHLYNITPFFGSHPGGDSIMEKYCGGDMTAAFSTKEKNPGTDHTDAAKQMLANYFIK